MPHRQALQLLKPFRQHVLPGLLRKLLRWKGLDQLRNADLVEDVSQELFLDCMQHGEEIAGLELRQRHARWLRVMDQCVYRLHVRSSRQRDPEASIDHLTAEGTRPSRDELGPLASCQVDLPPGHRRFVRHLEQHASYLKNGRINAKESAQALGLRQGCFKHAWGKVAAGLGLDEEFLEFWRSRLVEALVGLAADLLRDDEAVRVHREAQRRRPDPLGRLRRIRKLRDALASRPLPPDLKSVLTHYRRGPLTRTPRQILADAATLQPNGTAVLLWTFEAALSEGDFVGATRALRAARRTDAEAIPTLLARVRLLQARGRGAAARWLLARHPPTDPRLLAARQALAM